jgi:hypothetical protein
MSDVSAATIAKINETSETAVKAVKEAVAEAPAHILKSPKETKTVDPDALPKDEAHLVRSINVRMRRMEDNRITLVYELTELRKLTGARGLEWEAFCDKHILKPDGTPYAPKTIRDFIALGKEENVAKAIEDKRQQAVVRMREVRRKQKEAKAAERSAGRGKRAASRNLRDLDIFQVACTAWAQTRPIFNGGTVTMHFSIDRWRTLNQRLGQPHAEQL